MSSVPQNKLDVRFFFGSGATREPNSDEVFLHCDDSYLGLPEKVQGILKWAYDHGYDYVAKVDDDVVVDPVQWLASGFENYDFVGPKNEWVKPGEIVTPWGFFYVLSRKATKLCVDAALPGQPGSVHSYKHNNDEAWVSTVLYTNRITLQEDQRYFLHRGPQINKRPLNRGLRPLKRTPTPRPKPVEGTFATCIYIDSGLHNVPTEDRVKEFYKVYKETQECR